MSKSVQVIYPVGDGTTFDFEYYLGNHMAIVTEAAGRFVDRSLVTKGLSGGPDTPPGSTPLLRSPLRIRRRWMVFLQISAPRWRTFPISPMYNRSC